MQIKMEELQSQILHVISETIVKRDRLREKHSRFQVLLTTALRLLDGPKESVLEGLGGKPEQIRAYVIQQALELATDTSNALTEIHSMLERIKTTFESNK